MNGEAWAEEGRGESGAGRYLQLGDEGHRHGDQATSTSSPKDHTVASHPLPQSPVSREFPLSIHADTVLGREAEKGSSEPGRVS